MYLPGVNANLAPLGLLLGGIQLLGGIDMNYLPQRELK
jgi:hypothetical protein